MSASAASVHGARASYHSGCRCLPCRQANAVYELERRRDSQRLVDACRARAHVLALASDSIGLRTVAKLADLSLPSVWQIRSGRRRRILRETERKILAVTGAGDQAAGAIVDATETWQLIDELLEEGFSKARIAREIGWHGGELAIGKKRCRAGTAKAIRALWRKYMI